MQRNVLAMSGRAVEAAGDVDTLLLDKTGTITLGNRQAVEIIPAPGVSANDAHACAYLSSLADETPEGRSIVALARAQRCRKRCASPAGATFVPFSAYTRMSGVDLTDGTMMRKGAPDSVLAWVRERNGGDPSADPLVAGDRAHRAQRRHAAAARAAPRAILGVIHLKDILKPKMRERFDRLRAMGIRTVMITGDNPLTAAAIAHEAGVDDFLAEATPETKMDLIKREQGAGRLVAMTGDGTNDAPALAQADVGVAMNSGTQAAKEAANMVDLDSDPTKLIEVVEIGKQLLMTRGALTTFSIANDVAKYFAILPAMFVTAYPAMECTERHAPHDAAERDSLGSDLQCVDHHRADPARAAGRHVYAARRRRRAARKRADLRIGRHHHPVHRHQAHRSFTHSPPSDIRCNHDTTFWNSDSHDDSHRHPTRAHLSVRNDGDIPNALPLAS